MKASQELWPTALLCLLLLAGVLSPAPITSQELDSGVRGAFFAMVAEHFEVAVEEVSILGDWGLAPDEVPVVLFLSRRAGISADALVGLRRAGRSWKDVAGRFGLGASTFHIPLPTGTSIGALEGVYEQFRSRPAREWNQIELDDSQIISLVNVRVVSEAVGVSPIRVLQSRDEAGSFAAGFARLIGSAVR